jgi:hypothetical protein
MNCYLWCKETHFSSLFQTFKQKIILFFAHWQKKVYLRGELRDLSWLKRKARHKAKRQRREEAF